MQEGARDRALIQSQLREGMKRTDTSGLGTAAKGDLAERVRLPRCDGWGLKNFPLACRATMVSTVCGLNECERADFRDCHHRVEIFKRRYCSANPDQEDGKADEPAMD